MNIDGFCRVERQLSEAVSAATFSRTWSFQTFDRDWSFLWQISLLGDESAHPFWDEITRVRATFPRNPPTIPLKTHSIASVHINMAKPEPADDNEYERQRLANIEKNKKLLKSLPTQSDSR